MTAIRFALAWLLLVGNALVAHGQPTGLSTGVQAGPQGTYITGELAQILLPTSPGKSAGFKAVIKISEPRQIGYAQVSITLTAAGAFVADRRFVVTLSQTPGSYVPSDNGISIRLPIEVSQGDRSVAFARMVPRESIGGGYQVAIREDDRVLDGYNVEYGTPVGRRTRELVDIVRRELNLQTLVVSSDDLGAPESAEELVSLVVGWDPSFAADGKFDATAAEKWLARRWMGAAPGPVDWARLRLRLRSDWRAYQQFDAVILLNWDDVVRGDPARLTTLRDWALLGGIVVVKSAADPATVLAKFNVTDSRPPTQRSRRQLRFQAITELFSDADSIRDRMSQTGTAANRSRGAAMFQSLQGLGQPLVRVGDVTSEQGAAAIDFLTAEFDRAKVKRNRISTENSRVWSREIGAGRIIGVQPSDDAGRVNVVDWRHAQAIVSAGPSRATFLRRGVEPLLGDTHFSHWLIPGVAQPPVYIFIGLLTLFVILVGPVAYRLSMKHDRAYLIFLVAPVLALLTTLALLSYGVIADGFGIKARIRQLTWVDGQSGDAAERVRATYFAGIRPAAGLQFAGDAEVLNHRNLHEDSWHERSNQPAKTRGTVTVLSTSQRFSAEFLPSREQRQFVVHQPRHGVGSISLVNSDVGEAGAGPSVSSNFDFRIDRLVVCDADGQHWTADKAEPQAAKIQCRALDATERSRLLAQIYNDQLLVDTYRQAGSRPSRGWAQSDRLELVAAIGRSGYRLNFGPVRSFQDGNFEFWLREHLLIDGELPASSFIALAAVSPDVLAVEPVQLVDSIRIVFGTLR